MDRSESEFVVTSTTGELHTSTHPTTPVNKPPMMSFDDPVKPTTEGQAGDSQELVSPSQHIPSTMAVKSNLSYMPELEIPEMDYDEDSFNVDLAGDDVRSLDSSMDISAFTASPGQNVNFTGGLGDDDYEAELGTLAKELVVQDVIDSDFPDIARLGILQVAGDDKLGRKVILFCACRLPRTTMINHERLLAYVTRTLEQYVANDYCLIYLHYGLSSSNRPSWSWLVQAYRTLDRNFRKNLKSLYVVHPTVGIRFLWTIFKPFISSKFSRKVVYVRELSELEDTVFLNQLPIPVRVVNYNNSLARIRQPASGFAAPPENAQVPPPSVTSMQPGIGGVGQDDLIDDVIPEPNQQFGVSLQHIFTLSPRRKIPIVVEDSIDYLRDQGLNVEYLFRRSVSRKRLLAVQALYNTGEHVDLYEYSDPHLAAVLIKTFFRELKEPILTFELYDNILALHGLTGNAKIKSAMQLIVEKLPVENYNILKYFVQFLTEVVRHASENQMNATSLAVVFGPTLLWSRYHASLSTLAPTNAFAQLLITHYESIFIR